MARRQRGILDILSSAQRGRVSTSIQTTPSRASAPIYAQRLSARKKAEEARAEQLRSGIKRQNTISQVYRAASNAAKQRRGALDLMQDKMNRAYSTETRGDLLRGAYRSARTSGFDAKRAISNGGRNANVQKALAGLGGDEFGMGGRTLYRRGDSAGNVRNLTRHSNAYRRKVEAGVNDGGIFAPRSRIPTKEELEARQKYGFSKQYADYFNNLANSDRTVTLAKGQEPHVQPRGSFFRAPTKDIAINPDRYKLGLAESLMFNAPEKTASEQYGTALDEEGLAEARKSGSYMLGLGTGEGLQFMATAPLAAPIEAGIAGKTTLQGASRLGKVWKGVRSGKDAAKAYGSSVAAQEIVSLPINFIDALKENKGREGDWKRVAARFGLNQALDLFMAGAMELPGLSRNLHFANAQKYFDGARSASSEEVRNQLRMSAVHELSQLDNRTLDSVSRYLTEAYSTGRRPEMPGARFTPGERVTGENAFMRSQEPPRENIGANPQEPLGVVEPTRYNEPVEGGIANGEPVERAGAGPSDLRGTADEVPTSGRPEADSAGVETRPIIPEHEAATGNGGHVLLSEEQRKILTDSGVTDTHQGGADYATFSKALSDGRNANEYGGYVDPQSVDKLTEKGAKTFLSDDGKAGVGIAGDGDIFGVFKNPDSKYPDAVKDLLITARANGGTKMDCYGRVLVNNYEKGGYVPVGRVKFSEEIARMNLEDGVINQEQFDVLMREKPDIYFMMKNTDSLDDVIRKMANGEYHQSTQEELDALELFDDVVENGETVYGYDRATEARNNALAKQEGGAAEATPEESRIKVDGRELNEVEQDIYDKAYKKAAEKKVNGKPQGEGEAAEKAAKKAVRQQRNRIKKEGKEWIATEEHTSTGEAADFDNEWYERKLQDGKIPSYERGKNGEPSDVEHALNAIKRLLKTDQFKSIRKEVKVAIENGLFDRRVKHIQEYIDKAIREVENDPRKALDDILQYHPTGPKAGDVPADSIPWVTKAFVLTKWAEQHGYKGLQMDIASTVAKAQSSAGGMLRGGQIFTVMANKKTQREVIEKTMKDLTERFAKRLDGHELTMSDELWERLANAKTKQETADVLEDMSVHIWNQIPMGFMESLDTVRFMGMLSNPRTQIRNVVGNIGFVPPRLIKDGIATGYERILEAAGAIERSDRTHSVYNPFTKDSKEKLAYWDKMFQENEAEIMGHNRFDDNAASSSISTSRPMEARHWGIKAGGGTSKNPLSAGAEGIYQLTTKGLEGGDRIFLESSYKDSATKYMHARGWSLDDLTPARKAEIHAHAMQQAQKATYRDASELATLLSRWGRWEKGDGGAKFVRSIGVNSLMPFKKTPINVTKRAVEYSPAEVLKGTYDLVTGLKSGNKELIVQSADELASMTTGTGLVALGFWLAKNGVMNGELPTDEEGFIRKDLGEQDYAMTIGGKTISMDWFAPGIIPVMTGVSLYEMTKDQGLKDLTPDKIFDLISGSMQPMVEISFMQGTSNFLDTIGSEKGADKITAGSLQLALGYAGQIVPTMLGQINRTFFDPVRRDTASYAEGSTQRTIEKHINKAKAKIPGASKTLPAYVDFKGEEQVEESLPRRFFENFISPATIKDLNKDPVYKKMLDLQHKYPGEKVLPDNSLGTAKNKISFDGGQVTLDAKQMEQYKRNRGKANDDALREVLNNSELSDKDKLGALEDSYKKAKVGAKQKALLDMGKDEWKVYTDDFTGGKAEPDIYNAAKDAGIDAKTYYDYMSDPKVADKEFGDGNGYNSKQEMVNYLLSQEDLTNAQRAALLAGFNKRYADAKYNPFLNGTASYEDVSGGSKSGRSSGGSGRRSSGRRSSGSRSKSSKGREQTASEKAFAALHSSSAMGKRKQTNYAKYKTLTVAQRKAILKALRG